VVGADPRGFAARAHIPAVTQSPHLELSAICTAHEATARDAARTHGAKRWYADVGALVEDPDIDLVIVSVRPRFHAEIARASLDAGKATYCEWPLGRTTSEAAEMADVAALTEAPSAVGLQGRFAPAILELRDRLLRGQIGRVLAVDVSLLQAPFRVDSDRSWLIEKEEASGALHVATAHLTDAVQFVLENLASVTGIVGTKVKGGQYADNGEKFIWKTYDTVSYLAETPSGISISARISNVTRPALGFVLRVAGEDGQLMVRAPQYLQFSPAELFIGSSGSELEKVDIESPDGRDDAGPESNVARALEAFVGVSANPPSDVPDFADGLALHRVLDAIEQSSQSRRWVTIASG
jgi:predicted dehydrogenase